MNVMSEGRQTGGQRCEGTGLRVKDRCPANGAAPDIMPGPETLEAPAAHGQFLYQRLQARIVHLCAGQPTQAGHEVLTRIRFEFEIVRLQEHGSDEVGPRCVRG